jgi:hypothetical protein
MPGHKTSGWGYEQMAAVRRLGSAYVQTAEASRPALRHPDTSISYKLTALSLISKLEINIHVDMLHKHRLSADLFYPCLSLISFNAQEPERFDPTCLILLD